MAGASGDVAWMWCVDIRAVVFALTAGSGVCGTCRGAFACCRTFVGKTGGFWASKACWLLQKAGAAVDGGGILHIFVGLCGCASVA